MQYLVDWRSFLIDKCKNFPAKLCFPQFFYMSIISIIPNYYQQQRDKQRTSLLLNITKHFYNDLQSIVNIIFPKESINLITPEEMETLIQNYANHIPPIFYLETFIKDEDGRLNYQNALLKESLKYYEKENVGDIISYLCAKDCCSEEEVKEKDLLILPHSKHYITLNTNCTLKQLFVKNIFGPNIWGPYYWAIFHALAEGCTQDDIKVLDNYLKILPTLIPCELCRGNYYTHIRPSKLSTIKDKSHALLLYSKIHNEVTRHK